MIGKDQDLAKEYSVQLEKINKMMAYIDDLSPIYARFLVGYRKLVKENFEKEGVFFNGSKWAALKEPYATKKSKLRPGRKILQYDRDLISAATGENKINGFNTITKRTLEFGIRNIPYAQKHQKGSKDGKTAARPFLYDFKGKLPLQGLRFMRLQMEDFIKSIVEIAKGRGVI